MRKKKFVRASEKPDPLSGNFLGTTSVGAGIGKRTIFNFYRYFYMLNIYQGVVNVVNRKGVGELAPQHQC